MNNTTTHSSVDRGVMPTTRVLHRWLATGIVLAVAVQFALAGAGAFGATSFRPHTGLGWAIAVASLLALLIAIALRNQVRASVFVFVAVAVQVALGILGENSSAWFGALHGLNALIVAAAAINLVRATAGVGGHPQTSGPRPAPPDPAQVQ
jgi:hypothetical protein